MPSTITHLKEADNKLTFTISGEDVSYVNGIRRIILSEIPIFVFKTSPHAENTSTIIANIGNKLHNEIIKQRLSCIPICEEDIDRDMSSYLMELDVENKTDTTIVVTTRDFKVKDITTNKYVDDNTVKTWFPPFVPLNQEAEYYIPIVRLRPKFTDEKPGGQIKLNCTFSRGTAKEDGMFNVASTCSYSCTPDLAEINKQLELHRQKWKNDGKTAREIDFESANWKLLDGLRIVKPNSFDFVLESVGIYENAVIMVKACKILMEKMNALKNAFDKDVVQITPSDNTLDNCYDVLLEGEGHTIGNILNYELYTVFYSNLKVLDYVGFNKKHPHDENSTIRVCFTDKSKHESTVKTMMVGVIDIALKKLSGIQKHFV